MKTTICDVCKEIALNPKTVKCSINKQWYVADLCETCASKLSGFLGGNDTKPETDPAPASTAVKGFLYLKCPNCGAVRGFCAKQEINKYTCSYCHTTTGFGKLVSLRFRCECGASFGYLTNMTDIMFDIPCLECGSPVPVTYNAKRGWYENV